jgi:uncharacterized protein
MLRWIIILIVFFLVYRILRRFFALKMPTAKKPPDQIQDEMVQDPVCGTYVPKRMALLVTRPGEGQVFFCSPACRDKFLAEGAGTKAKGD